MISLRGLWNRHKRKALISLGFFGGGYVLYKLYESQKLRNLELEKQLEVEREADELIKTQLQTHYENIQRISDSTTLPYAMHYMRMRILDDLDLSHVTEKLMQGKGQGGGLTSKEKLELWERLKILSFTRVATSMWSMTMLCLYVRIQVNILGRHLYLQVARGLEGSGTLVKDEEDSFSRHGQQDFLATADYLSTYGIDALITTMRNAAMEVLKETQLKDPFSMPQLRESIVQILDLFMKINTPDYWIRYLVPESATAYRQLMATSSKGFDDSSVLMDVRKLEQLMSETRAVLSSPDFANIVDVSLKKVVDVLVEDVDKQLGRPSGYDISATNSCSFPVVPVAVPLAAAAHVYRPVSLRRSIGNEDPLTKLTLSLPGSDLIVVSAQHPRQSSAEEKLVSSPLRREFMAVMPDRSTA